MSESISKSFTEQYQADVHIAFQRMGSLMRNTVRLKKGVKGASTVFQRTGKGKATKKGRGGVLVGMNIDHSPVKCFLEDSYAPDLIDDLDELKIEHDERMVIVRNGAYALGREIDNAIFEATKKAKAIGSASEGMTKEKAKLIMKTFGKNDVPDRDRVVWVGWDQWGELLDIPEFAKTEFIGSDKLPWLDGGQAKNWLGATWMPHSGVPIISGVRQCLTYHKNAVGAAFGHEISSRIDYVPEKAAHLALNKMSMGAVMIDETAVFIVPCKEA